MPRKPKAIKTIADLTPDPHNPRKRTQRNLGMITESLQQLGAGRSILIDENGRVIAGNGVVESAALAGITNVQVVDADGETIVAVRRTGLTEDQKKLMAVADNRAAELAEWDSDVLAAMQQAGKVDLSGFFYENEISAIVAGASVPPEPPRDPGPQVDRAAELQLKWQTANGQLWQIGRHRLICGDATSKAVVDRVMDGDEAALTFTSLPYAVGVDYGDTYEDTLDNLRALLREMPALIMSVTRPGGYAVTNFGDIVSAKGALATPEVCEYPMAVEYWPAFYNKGWYLHTRRIWAKPHARVAAPWCASSNRAASDWEHLWTWKKSGLGLNERRAPSYLGVWDTSKDDGVDVGKEVHGAGMALAVPNHCISIYTNPRDIVFEPFTGTGTTLVSCEFLGRYGRGIEISPAYAAVTLERMSGMGLTPQLMATH